MLASGTMLSMPQQAQHRQRYANANAKAKGTSAKQGYRQQSSHVWAVPAPTFAYVAIFICISPAMVEGVSVCIFSTTIHPIDYCCGHQDVREMWSRVLNCLGEQFSRKLQHQRRPSNQPVLKRHILNGHCTSLHICLVRTFQKDGESLSCLENNWLIPHLFI